MIRRPWERKRADAFADALDGRHHTRNIDREVKRLVEVAEALCRADLEAPRPEFATGLRLRLMTEATTALAPAHKSARRVVRVQPVRAPVHPFRRRIAAATVTIGLAAGSFALVTESASALPGQSLYPVKRGVENVQVALQRGPSAVGSARLGQASNRLDEVQALVRDGDGSAKEGTLVADTLDDFAEEARRGGDSLFESYSAKGNDRTVDKVNEFAATSGRILSSLSATLPTRAGDAYTGAADTVVQLTDQAASVCSSCVTPNLSDLPRSLTGAVQDLADESDLSAGSDKSTTSPDKSKTSGTKTQSQQSDPSSPAAPPSDGLPKIVLPSLGTPSDSSGDSSTAPKSADPLTPATEPVQKAIDPVVSGLLGDGSDGSTPGLVPGLLDGLLGSD